MRSKFEILFVDLSPIDGTMPSENTKFRKHAGFKVRTMNRNGFKINRRGFDSPTDYSLNLFHHHWDLN